MTRTSDNGAKDNVDETKHLLKSVKNGELALLIVNGLLLIVTVIIACIYNGQLNQMRKATDAATQASQTAKDTLTEMRTGSGAQDTHNLAQQAVTQATQTTNLASAAKKEAEAMSQQLSVLTASQIPIVFLKEMPQETESIGQDSGVKWREVWHNSGGTKPVELKIWSDCTDYLTTTPIEFHRKVAYAMKLVIGPGTDKTIAGCEASYSYLKKIDDENHARVAARDETRRQFYVLGGADYKDFLGHPHTFEYCNQLWWNNRSLKFGFELIPCYPPNDKYTCIDEECQDWNPKRPR